MTDFAGNLFTRIIYKNKNPATGYRVFPGLKFV